MDNFDPEIILTELHPLFKESISSLKSASRDDANSVEMTQSNLPCIKFDTVKKKYALKHFPSAPNTYKSVDAILQTASFIFFIEFKNGKLDGEERAKIREKLSNSYLLFSDILNTTFSKFRNYSIFILVYNENKFSHPSQNKIANNITKKVWDL